MGSCGSCPRPDEFGEAIQDLLSPANGEGWNEYFLAFLNSSGKDLVELFESLFARTVVAIAVGRLEKDQVGVVKRCGIANNG